MIAKASTISHGANAIRYSVNKEKADIVKANLLPDNISPEAMYGRMMLVQRKFAENINKGRPLGRNVIRNLSLLYGDTSQDGQIQLETV